MNLTELYGKIPVQHHDRIVVIGNEVQVNLPQRILTFWLIPTDEGERLVLKGNCELTPDVVSSLTELGLYP